MNRSQSISLNDISNPEIRRINPHLFGNGTNTSNEVKEALKSQKKAKQSKTRDWVELQLFAWCEAEGFTLHKEYKFNEKRKWRADWFIEELNCLIEWEGLMSAKSRHTTATGYSNDASKYNSAITAGFRLIRLTILNHKTLFNHLEEIKSKV